MVCHSLQLWLFDDTRAPHANAMDNLPKRYAEQIREAEEALRKMEEQLSKARETIEHAKKILKGVTGQPDSKEGSSETK